MDPLNELEILVVKF